MHKSVRAAAAATALAVAAVAGIAAAVEAGSAPVTAVVGERTTKASATPAPVQPTVLPDVTTADIDPAQLAAAGAGSDAAPSSIVQVIELSVVGGALELVDEHASVVLERVPGSVRDWVGVLPPVRVVDARGSHEGWEVRWSVEDVSRDVGLHRIKVRPHEPVVVAGLADGLVEGSDGRGNAPRPLRLLGAEPGFGGGTYEAGATVTVRLPPKADVDEVVVDLAFSLS